MNENTEEKRSFCDRIDRRIRLHILDAPMIINNFVQGDGRCNYELYLVEMLNNSKWMKRQFPEVFRWQEEQSHSECDAYSGNYGIDFKLAAAKSKLQAKSLLSNQIQLIAPREYATCASKKSGEMKSIRLFAALRPLTINELRQVATSEIKQRSLENDLSTFVHTISIKKNLLLFFPYRFYSDNGSGLEGDDLDKAVVSGLNVDFSAAMAYRAEVAPGYDTFFATICESRFLLMKYQANSLSLIDVIPTNDCPTYEHLYGYTDWLFS